MAQLLILCAHTIPLFSAISAFSAVNEKPELKEQISTGSEVERKPKGLSQLSPATKHSITDYRTIFKQKHHCKRKAWNLIGGPGIACSAVAARHTKANAIGKKRNLLFI